MIFRVYKNKTFLMPNSAFNLKKSNMFGLTDSFEYSFIHSPVIICRNIQ